MAEEGIATGIAGIYRDVVRDQSGRVTADSGWRKNAIMDDCHRLLAGFMRGQTNTLGIQALLVGAGDPNWDQVPPGPRTSLFDGHPYRLLPTNMTLSFLQGANVVTTPTNRLQVVATLAPGIPHWPDQYHGDATLREFALVGKLNSSDVLIDYVAHPAIPKDPLSSLERTIWLTF